MERFDLQINMYISYTILIVVLFNYIDISYKLINRYSKHSNVGQSLEFGKQMALWKIYIWSAGRLKKYNDV